jgi:hypothetical protein
MKYSSVIWGIAATFSIHSAKAAQECSRYLALPTDQVVKVEELRDRSWISASDSNIEAAGEFERERKAKGETATQEELERVLGGSKVHLRQTTLPSGLIFVTIHKTEDGTEIFDAHTYHGLISCNCGAIHDAPAVSQPSIIEGTPLGDGFNLYYVLSSANSHRTSSTVKKIYDLPGQDGSVELNYSIKPAPESNGLKYLNLEHKQTLLKTTTDGERTNGVIQIIKAVFYEEKLRTFEITLAHNLSPSKWEAAFDQVHLIFDPNGKLETITGISQSSLPNLAWSKNSDMRFFLALKKGQNEWFDYEPQEPEAALIFKSVLGRDIGRLKGISFSAVKEIIDSAKAERPLLVHSLLDLDPI